MVVELAQNAADAAAAAGVPGHLELTLTEGPGPTLVAANTGAPLTAAGVASLASLRASAKRGAAAVGRFGVGFAAVRSVSDEIAVVSTTGAVHFSLHRAAAALRAFATLAPELAARGDRLPVLRLPCPGPGPEAPGLPPGADTAVVLHLRDEAAVAQVREQLEALDDAILLALPALGSVTVRVGGDERTLADAADRWLVVRAAGEVDPTVLADRPVEERERPGWNLAWAVHRTGQRDGSGRPEVVHAPTPTDERCSVPALLLGTFPLDPGRRHVVAGPVTDALVVEAARLWPDLLAACRHAREAGDEAPDPLDLLPTGWPAGPLDAALHAAVLEATRTAPVLAGPDGPVTPADATVLAPPWTSDVAATRLLGRWFGTLARLDARHRGLIGPLGVRAVPLGELVEQLPATDPASLADVYALLGAAGPDELAEIAAAPVPLADGRVVHGARGLVVVDADVPAAPLVLLQEWGLRVVHPAAAHPVLERLGAQRVDAAVLAVHPLLRERVLDEDEDAADALLPLVSAAPSLVGPGWWSRVLLPAADGELEPARGLVLPGSPAQEWFDPQVLPPVAGDLVARHGTTLVRVGVRAGLVVERADEAIAEELEDWQDYLDVTGAADDGELLVVADLDAVVAWRPVLAAVEAEPAALAPARDDAGRPVPSYAAWRLRRTPGLGLGAPFAVDDAVRPARGVVAHLPGPPALVAGLASVQAAVGGVRTAEDLTSADWAALLDELDGPVPLDLAVDCWRALARLAAAPGGLGELLAAGMLPAWDGEGTRMVDVDEVAVSGPMHAQHLDALPAVLVPDAAVEVLADALDLDRAVDRVAGHVEQGVRRVVPAAVRALVDVPATWQEHEELLVDGTPVAWWVDGDEVHARGSALADALAAVGGRRHRQRIAAVLADPDAWTTALLDEATDD